MNRQTRLLDGSPICSDFSIVAMIPDPKRIESIRLALALLGSTTPIGTQSTSNSDDVDIRYLDGLPFPIQCRTYAFKQDHLNKVLAAFDEQITSREFNALATTLCNNGVAIEETTSRGYADYRIEVTDPLSALRILDQIIIATYSQVSNSTSSPNKENSSVEVVSTLPKEVVASKQGKFSPIRISIRKQLANASEIVRIANPYFDSTDHVIDDLAAIPRRGVQLRLITREAEADEPNQSTLDALEKIISQLSDSKGASENLSIRDFYETNRWNRQTGATHAKVIVIDDTVAYLGSANLTRLSLSGNFELGVLLRGKVVQEVIDIFDAMFDYATPIRF